MFVLLIKKIFTASLGKLRTTSLGIKYFVPDYTTVTLKEGHDYCCSVGMRLAEFDSYQEYNTFRTEFGALCT